MEIVYVYQRKRKEFGRQAIFSDKPAELLTDIPADPSYMRNYVVRNPINAEVQVGPELSEHEMNTESRSFSNQGIKHTEGGWPKDVDPSDAEHTIRYRKKIEKDEDYPRQVSALGELMEHAIKQNNAIDIYEEYFVQDLADEQQVAPPSAKITNVYRDPNTIKRSAAAISWYPDDGHKFAVAYSMLDFQKVPADMCLDSYIWNVEHPSAPESVLTPSSPLVSIKYNPKDPHVLVGGMYNGLVAYWDTRKGTHPVDTSSIEKSHRDPVYSLAWVSSKTGSEFFSSSTDGQVMWWDIRKLSEPTETMQLDIEKTGTVVGGTALDFETTMPTKFMVGTETGQILMCNKKAKSTNDRIQHAMQGHHGPVYSLQRNPFFTKNFLTVGDWTAKVWFEDVKSPIMSTKYHSAYLTDACWSPTRPSVFMTSKIDGTVDVWDYTFKQSEPTLSIQICQSPIHSLKVQERGNVFAVGARDGSVTLLELSDGLVKPQKDEKARFSAMLEREAKREKTLEGIQREKRLKAQAAAQQNKPSMLSSKADGQQDSVLSQAEAEFDEMTKYDGWRAELEREKEKEKAKATKREDKPEH